MTDPISIILNEDEKWPDTEDEKTIALKLSEKLNESDIKLKELLVEKKILEFDEIKDKGIRITAKNFIGAASFSNFHLKIIPKIYTKEDTEIWKNIATCINFNQ